MREVRPVDAVTIRTVGPDLRRSPTAGPGHSEQHQSTAIPGPYRERILGRHLVINFEKAHSSRPITTSELILHSAF